MFQAVKVKNFKGLKLTPQLFFKRVDNNQTNPQTTLKDQWQGLGKSVKYASEIKF